jgi:hypothetical protein
MPEGGNEFSGNTVGNWNSGTGTQDARGSSQNMGAGTQNVQINNNSREATLEQIDQLIARLLAGLAELPPDQAAIVAGEAVAVKNEAHAPSPDNGRIRQALQRLAEGAAPAAKMVGLVRQLAELIGQLVH